MTDEDPDERSSVDLSGLTDSECVLHTIISEIVSRETSVLDPDDSDILALVVVEQLPEVYKAAPELLEALKQCVQRMEELQEVTNFPLAWPRVIAKEAISKAKGESQ